MLTHRNINIPFEPSKKFLGLIYDQKLQWKEQIETLRRKALKSLSILKILSRSHWGADRLSLLRVYRAIVRSKIDFGCQAYQPAKPKVLQQLDPIHNMAIRLCTGTFRSSPVDSLYAESGESPLYIRRMQLTLQHYMRIQRLTGTSVYSAVFEPAVVGPYECLETLSAPFGIIAQRYLQEMQYTPS